MQIYKCDRCGRLYERKVKKILYVEKEGIDQDLCPDCAKSLDEWWWWEAGKEQNNDTGRSYEYRAKYNEYKEQRKLKKRRTQK